MRVLVISGLAVNLEKLEFRISKNWNLENDYFEFNLKTTCCWIFTHNRVFESPYLT